jgi:uncharacterized protein with PQ loop repeat
MFTQLLGTVATVYGVLGALKSLLQTRQMLARRTSRDVSAGFLASYVGGYAIWLAYGLSTGSLPLIVVDTVGLLCGGLTLAVALSLRGSVIRPATWNSGNTTSISQHAQPQTRSPTPWSAVRRRGAPAVPGAGRSARRRTVPRRTGGRQPDRPWAGGRRPRWT